MIGRIIVAAVAELCCVLLCSCSAAAVKRSFQFKMSRAFRSLLVPQQMRVSVIILLLLLAVLASAHPHLRPRQSAPQFKGKAVINQEFKEISLQEQLTQGKWTVLLFYPFDFTFVCPTEILAFNGKLSEFQSLDTSVIGISTDSVHTHLAWIRSKPEDGGLGHIDIPLIGDVSKEISKAYGVLVDEPNDPMYGAALRGLFIIDPKGIIRTMQIVDDQVGRSVDETLRLLKAFQYAETHAGHVCPATWTKSGDKTIRATPEGIREYLKEFSQAQGKTDL
jgi:alkyl hydroperoxide reductase subunit AhpC